MSDRIDPLERRHEIGLTDEATPRRPLRPLHGASLLVLIVAGVSVPSWSALLTGCGERGESLTYRRATPATVSNDEPGRNRAPEPLRRPTRAVWVARYHYRTPEDIAGIMRNCAQLGLNTVLWQVRGEATVAYPSRIEPWSIEYGHADPGFDPLAIAVREAHRHGLRIEAWINVMPGWRGKRPPRITSHIYHTHPEFFLHDAAGKRQALNDDYVILNPCLPEVRDYVCRVVHELVSNYAVDGLHLDYVRYAWDRTPNAQSRYPRDPRTLALFMAQTGRSPDADPAAWDAWRANQLTLLVLAIREQVDRARPGATLTAAVWRNPQLGMRDYFQNSAAWARSGALDMIYPMTYTADAGQLKADIQMYLDQLIAGAAGNPPRARIAPGLGLYRHTAPTQTREQLGMCQAWGGDFALFSYDSLFANAADRAGKGPDAATTARRNDRRAVISATSGLQ